MNSNNNSRRRFQFKSLRDRGFLSISMTSMYEIPHLLGTYEDSFVGPVVVERSRVLGNDVFCGNGLFCTESVPVDGILFLMRPYSSIVITVENALQDADCGTQFRELVKKYYGEGGDMLSIAGWLAKKRICDMLDDIKNREQDEYNSIDIEEEKDTKSEFLTAYVSALPWNSEDQDHVIWWLQDEADELLQGCEVIGDEASRIRREVTSAVPLLAEIIGPVVTSKLESLAPSSLDVAIEELVGFDGFNDLDIGMVCNILLSSYLRAAFVILMTRSFDSTFEGSSTAYHSGTSNLSGGGESILVPVMDMMQHTSAQRPNVYHICDIDSDCIGVFAARELLAGEELVISYHKDMDKAIFGARFGFVPGEVQSLRRLLKAKSSLLCSTC